MNKSIKEPKVAIIHEWLTSFAGSEKVVEQLLVLYPSADLFVVCDFMSEKDRYFLQGKKTSTTFIQKLPFAKNFYRNYLPLMPLAIEQFDMSSYDIVISSSHAVAKGIITGPDQLHICYCHSPMRYAWDLQHQYLKESGNEKGLKSLVMRYLLHRLRIWDYRTASGVDQFIANSGFIARRIKKIYGRTAQVIYPGVAVDDFELKSNKKDFYLAASRMVPYKKMQMIAEAFAKLPDKQLVIIGDGPEYGKVEQVCRDTDNIKLLGYQSFEKLREHMQDSKAFVFAAEEDFGIIPVESMACGTPVIAFGKGGALETVIDGETGVLFKEQTVESLIDAIQRLEDSDILPAEDIRQHALQFGNNEFQKQMKETIQLHWREF